MAEGSQKIIIGVTGASGSLYAHLLLKKLAELNDQYERVDVVFSKPAREVWKYELPEEPIKQHEFKNWAPDNFWSPLASGSAGYDTMVVVPCTVGTLGRIASGQANDLITRAADVMLKERAKLILVTRETPLSLIHINNMQTITQAGGIILPAEPGFYSKPDSIEELAMTVVERILKQMGLESGAKGFMG